MPGEAFGQIYVPQVGEGVAGVLVSLEMVYDVDPLKETIATSWPNKMDDSCARAEWDWKPQFDLSSMTVDMLDKLTKKLSE